MDTSSDYMSTRSPSPIRRILDSSWIGVKVISSKTCSSSSSSFSSSSPSSPSSSPSFPSAIRRQSLVHSYSADSAIDSSLASSSRSPPSSWSDGYSSVNVSWPLSRVKKEKKKDRKFKRQYFSFGSANKKYFKKFLFVCIEEDMIMREREEHFSSQESFFSGVGGGFGGVGESLKMKKKKKKKRKSERKSEKKELITDTDDSLVSSSSGEDGAFSIISSSPSSTSSLLTPSPPRYSSVFFRAYEEEVNLEDLTRGKNGASIVPVISIDLHHLKSVRKKVPLNRKNRVVLDFVSPIKFIPDNSTLIDRIELVMSCHLIATQWVYSLGQFVGNERKNEFDDYMPVNDDVREVQCGSGVKILPPIEVSGRNIEKSLVRRASLQIDTGKNLQAGDRVRIGLLAKYGVIIGPDNSPPKAKYKVLLENDIEVSLAEDLLDLA